MMGFGLLRIRGESMAPSLRHGDLVLTRRWGRRKPAPQVGAVLCVDHPVYGAIVKRVTAVKEQHIALAGDGPASTPSMDLGWVPAARVRSALTLRLSRPFDPRG
ncbi:MAG: S26 family signal peptidase [Pseudomonadota bacterium]